MTRLSKIIFVQRFRFLSLVHRRQFSANKDKKRGIKKTGSPARRHAFTRFDDAGYHTVRYFYQ